MPTPQEQKVLAAYSGWGGLTNAFKDGTKENNELRKLLTKDEYDAAKRSILDAYFTPPAIVRAIWKASLRWDSMAGACLTRPWASAISLAACRAT